MCSPNPVFAELSSSLQLDYIIVDMEHGAIDVVGNTAAAHSTPASSGWLTSPLSRPASGLRERADSPAEFEALYACSQQESSAVS